MERRKRELLAPLSTPDSVGSVGKRNKGEDPVEIHIYMREGKVLEGFEGSAALWVKLKKTTLAIL